MKLTFHEDPGHGWLAVPVEAIIELGIQDKITSYSYLHEGIAYLEEDLDYGTFLTAAEAAGIKIETRRQYAGNTPIRNYPAFRALSLDNQPCIK